MPTWTLKGEYLKNCNCLASCPCDTIGEPAPHSYCEGLVGMNIQQGHFDAVDLVGLKWVEAFHFPGAMHQGNGDRIIYIDRAAAPAQRDALQQILLGKAGGAFFEIAAAVLPNLKGIHVVPIEWQFDMGRRTRGIEFDWKRTHSSLAHVEHTDKGLLA